MQASGKVIAYRYSIVIPDEHGRPYLVRFEGCHHIIEQAELFCHRLLRIRGEYETVIETADGEAIIEEGRLGELVGDPLYKHVCVHCGEADWCDIPPGRDDVYLCNICTMTLRSERIHTYVMLN